MKRTLIAIVFALMIPVSSQATIFHVGPTQSYTVPSAVMGLVQNGDTIDIDAATYSGDVGFWTKDNLVIRGVGSYAHLEAAGKSAGQKAIWVVQGAHTCIENIEFSGAAVSDMNGAGIRLEGAGLELRHCYFHDNQDGVLAGDVLAKDSSDVLFEACEFAHNGAGDGYSHNMYINHLRSFTLRFCYIHSAQVGHEVKSRALSTYILYNRITDEADGTASYCVDLPNGGLAIIMGNVIQKGPNAQNHPIIRFGEEGQTNPVQELYVAQNTIVSEDAKATFILPAAATTKAVAVNNIFAGPGTVYGGAMDTADNIITLQAPEYNGFWRFKDSLHYDYHIISSDVVIHKLAYDPTTAEGYSLTPTMEYVHPLDSVSRFRDDASFGAFNWESPGSVATKSPATQPIVIPNPATTNAAVVMNDAMLNGSSVQLTVSDALGRVMFSRSAVVSDGKLNLPTGLPSGAYSYRITSHDLAVSGHWVVR